MEAEMTLARKKMMGLVCFVAVAGLAVRMVLGANSHWGFVLGAVVILGLLVFAFTDWRLMDEVSREAHKSGAVWGVATGVAAWAIIMSGLMVSLGPDYGVSVSGHQGSLAIFVAGGLIALVAQAVCSGVGLAGWWISRRGARRNEEPRSRATQ
jgi:hypothetical protein